MQKRVCDTNQPVRLLPKWKMMQGMGWNKNIQGPRVGVLSTWQPGTASSPASLASSKGWAWDEG